MKRLWLPVSCIWASFILFVSVIPAYDLPSISIWEPDKLAHFIVYSFLVFCVINAYARQIKNAAIRSHPKIYGVVSCISYGIGIEFIQRLLPTRSFDVYDRVANFAGCFAGLLIAGFYLRKNPA